MLRFILSNLRQFGEVKRFNASDAVSRKLVFYSHGADDWLVIEPILLELLHQFKLPLSFITTNPNDPIRHMPPVFITPYLIGQGRIRQRFLERLECETLVVCNESAVKKPFPFSPKVKNYACYIPSLKSVRTTVCEENLKLFNTFLCSANHQMADLDHIQKTEGRHYTIFPAGSTRIDRALRIADDSRRVGSDKIPTVFVAFTNPAVEYRDTVVSETVRRLLERNYQVILRPPHQWLDRSGSFIRALYDRFATRDLFFPDGEQSSNHSIYHADILVTDSVEMAWEMGLTLEYPFVLLDLGTTNDTSSVDTNFESKVQSVFGPPLSHRALNTLPDVVEQLLLKRHSIAAQIRELRKHDLINPKSSAVATAYILAGKYQPKPTDTAVIHSTTSPSSL